MPLFENRKKRSRTSSEKRWFHRPAQKKVAVADTTALGSERDSGCGPSDGDTMDSVTVKTDLKSKIRRGSSKILSLFRLSSSNSKSSKAVTATTASDNEIGSNAGSSNGTGNNPPCAHALDGSATPDTVQHSLAVQHPEVSTIQKPVFSGSTIDESPTEGFETESDRQCRPEPSNSSAIPTVRRKPSASLRRSQSTPGLTHRLSHRLSSTFGQPTVVHRTNMRSRPSVRSMQDIALAVDPAQLTESDQGSTQPSSYNNTTASSSLRPSTNPTTDSASSSGPNMSPIERARSLLISNSQRPSLTLATIAEDTTFDYPTITTVEATVIAKTFLENHFNSAFYQHKPRSLRRQKLESGLYSLNMSVEAKNFVRQQWARQESEWLREERVLKSKSIGMRKVVGVSVGGYEVAKVLGKGSFGVVRLVKEKIDPKSAEASRALSNSPTKRLSMADLAQVKAAAKHLMPRKKHVKITKEVYAMKVIRKTEMLRNSQEGHIRAERDLLVTSASQGSRWIVPLVASFQDYKYLYLVMDYCVGGDFLGLLIRKNTLPEEVTKWYVAEMILCVEEAHRLRWIHRDVKPDNFLITASGHLKISDFGLAFDGEWSHDQNYYNNHRLSLMDKLGIKLEGDEQDKNEAQTVEASQRLAHAVNGYEDTCKKTVDGPERDEKLLEWRNRAQRRRLAKSVVGTSQYMAPEVIRGELYDGRCDWWSIGIILYECLYGFTPFACETRQNTKMKILKFKTSLTFPPDQDAISNDAIDLILSLLQQKERRLCSRKYVLNDYIQPYPRPPCVNKEGLHLNRANASLPADMINRNRLGYFGYADDADELKSHPFFRGIHWSDIHLRRPPFVPRVKSWDDTRYFDEEEPVSDIGTDTDSGEQEAVASPEVNKNNPSCVGSHRPENQHIMTSGGLGNMPGKVDYNDQKKMHRSFAMAAEGNILKREVMLLEAQADGAAGITGGPSRLSGNPLYVPKSSTSPQHMRVNDQLLTPPTSPKSPGRAFPIITPFVSSMVPLHSANPPAEEKAGGNAAGGASQPTIPARKRVREKKRPRDKALRDPATAKTVLDIRRGGAFLGYEWKRQDRGGNDVLGRAVQEVVHEGKDLKQKNVGANQDEVRATELRKARDGKARAD